MTTTRAGAGHAFLGALLCWCLGCDGGPAGARQPGEVRGVVDYPGRLAGPLRVAAFATFPPAGAPLAEQVIDRPVFPQAYCVAGLPGGRSFVLAMVDTDPADGDRFHPTVDPGGAVGGYLTPTAITVDASTGVAGADIALVDPAPASPWGRYR